MVICLTEVLKMAIFQQNISQGRVATHGVVGSLIITLLQIY